MSFHYTWIEYLTWTIYILSNRSAYHRPFNGYPYQSYLQPPPRYSQRSFQPPPYPFKQPDFPYPLTSSTRPSSLKRSSSFRNSSRTQSHSDVHNRGTTLKKRRRASTTQTPASHISEALSSTKLARNRPHDWRSGYKPPSKSYFRTHFERLTATFALDSKF